jgi:hypothetical protein
MDYSANPHEVAPRARHGYGEENIDERYEDGEKCSQDNRSSKIGLRIETKPKNHQYEETEQVHAEEIEDEAVQGSNFPY